jgi:hypothetical protein
MGIFDFFKRTDNKSDRIGKRGSGTGTNPQIAKLGDRAGDRRAQPYDRQEALADLAEMTAPLKDEDELAKTKDGQEKLAEHAKQRAAAVGALCRRFTFTIDPSITDQEEKQMAFDAILSAGPHAVEPVRAFAEKAESLAWPMKIMKTLLDREEYTAELLVWLSKWDTEYAKFIDPKLQLLVELEEHKAPAVLEAVKPFLLDVNEPARFHAVGAVLFQDDESSIPDLISCFCDEESVRIRTRICEGFAARNWTVPEESRADARKSLPSGWTIDGEGYFRKR